MGDCAVDEGRSKEILKNLDNWNEEDIQNIDEDYQLPYGFKTLESKIIEN